jgi:phytoene dehydrogenase-like protein
VLETPPNVGGGLHDVLGALRVGRRLRGLDLPARRDLLELFTRSAGEWLDGWFESAPLKAALGWDAVVGHYASPYAAGSAYVLLHHAFGEVNGKRGVWGHAIGGMGAITQAMAAEARARGVAIEVEAPVARVNVANGRVAGVTLRDGRTIEARVVAGAINPRLLFLDLVAAGDLDADFRARMRRWQCGSGTFRMNVALSELPEFVSAPGRDVQPHHRSGIVMAPSLDYMDRCWRDARAHGIPAQPMVEMLLPSTVDDTLAPPGAHVATLFCQHFAPELPDGASWDTHRDQAVARVIDTVTAYAPNFRRVIVGLQALSPLDLERTFGLVGGDIFHGRLSLDQLYSARPVLGYGDYRTPVRGLYLCGSGAHPGGGVTGAPGHNAAREILRDWRRSRL